MPSTSTDILDGVSSSLAVKAPVRVATTAAITLSGEQTIDGVAVVAGDRVLVKNQTDPVDNGIWKASASAWTRAADFNGARDVVQGTMVKVTAGTVNAGFTYAVTTVAPEIGVTAIAWADNVASAIAGAEAAQAAAEAAQAAAEAAADDAEAALAAIVRKKHVILATGQSNIALHVSYSWTPAANCFLWNHDGLTDAATHTGTAFAAMPTGEMAYAYSYANELAVANPDWDVYLVNVGQGTQPISKWMTGGPSPDLYACCKNNVEAALTVLGISTIDEMLWWQGESDVSSSTYAADFETVHARFKAETWFYETTPVAMASLSLNFPGGTVGLLNSVIKHLVQCQPAVRTLVDIGGHFEDIAWWDAGSSYLHLTAIGYLEAGKLAYIARHGNGVLSSAQWRTILKHTSTSRTANTTLASDPHLFFPMKSGRSYTVRGRIIGTSGATPDFKWDVTGPTGTTILYHGQIKKTDTIATIVGDNGGAYPTGKTVLQGGGGGLFEIEFNIDVLPATADGVFAFRWAQNTSDAGATIVVLGSYIEYIEFG